MCNKTCNKINGNSVPFYDQTYKHDPCLSDITKKSKKTLCKNPPL